MSTQTNPSHTLDKYPCPRCQSPTQWQDNKFKPFCSEKCKLIDLGAWANEDYKISNQFSHAEDDVFSSDLDRE